MSSSVCLVNADGQVPCKIKVEKDAEDIIQNTEGKMESFLKRITKRTAAHTGPDAHAAEVERHPSRKRVKVTTQAVEYLQDGSSDDGSRSNSQGPRFSPQEPTHITSYRKPLYSITHRISERKAASNSDQHGAHNGLRASHNGLQDVHNLSSSGKHHALKASPIVGVTGSSATLDSHLYPLIEKMFFLLNTLNSSMTQLHSKVDLLSLEVTRIKKQMKPSEMVMEFQPPPEYQLTGDELSQLMEQTSTAGDLGCRLLVQLFPELFTAKECTQGCSACGLATKRTLDSLHLQLIRNYVEVCYPLVKNENVWQTECLMQINDFLNRFWAQKDMESGQVFSKQAPVVIGFDIEQNHSCCLINEDGQDENLSLNSGDNNNDIHSKNVSSDATFDPRVTSGDDSEDLTSHEDLVIFLLNRLFPEVFEEGRLPESISSIGQLVTDSDRLEIIRKYMEANFPDVLEDTWLQLCVQRMEEALEGVSLNGRGHENNEDEMYEPSRLPDNISVIKIGDLCDYEKTNRRPKKTWLENVDFDQLDVALPDFDVPQEYILTKEQLKNNYECSLSIGNFASRLLVLMFPELFTYENARKHYNCSGSLGKKQLDPVRVNLIRHYVQLLYPQAKNDRVWTLEFVGKLDERCRRRDTDQRRSYQQQRKSYSPEQEPDPKDFQTSGQINILTSDRSKEDFEVLSTPLEKSSKDFCKIPLEDLSVSTPDFPVPPDYLLTDVEVREIVQQSLSVGNFAARLLVRLFPELFTQDNLRLQYNHSGACNKKQLDPVRLRLIRHYVEAVYPVEKMDEVWHYECVPSIDERCRRPNRKKCDILKKAKRSNNTVTYS